MSFNLTLLENTTLLRFVIPENFQRKFIRNLWQTKAAPNQTPHIPDLGSPEFSGLGKTRIFNAKSSSKSIILLKGIHENASLSLSSPPAGRQEKRKDAIEETSIWNVDLKITYPRKTDF